MSRQDHFKLQVKAIASMIKKERSQIAFSVLNSRTIKDLLMYRNHLHDCGMSKGKFAKKMGDTWKWEERYYRTTSDCTCGLQKALLSFLRWRDAHREVH